MSAELETSLAPDAADQDATLRDRATSNDDRVSLRPRVLIVEDQAVVGADIEMTLSEMGYNPTCLSGKLKHALEHLRNEAEKIDFVLLDTILFGETCLPLAKLLDDCHVPHLLISGQSEEEIRALGLTGPYLGKPFSERELIEAMQRHLPLPISQETK